MNKPLVSFILPVYNVGQYLEKCVESITRQGIDHLGYEIIAIDDGSTDSSFQVLEKLGDRLGDRMKIARQANCGVSAARNRGVAMASGEYVTFVDPDDYLVPGAMSAVLDAKKDILDYDLIRFSSTTVDRYFTETGAPPSSGVRFDGNGRDMLAQHMFQFSCWGFLVRRSWLSDHSIEFELIPMGEDFLYALQLWASGPRTISVDTDAYRYVVREGSAITRRDNATLQRAIDGYMHFLRRSAEISNSDPDLREPILALQHGRMVPMMSRMLNASLPLGSFKAYGAQLRRLDILPMAQPEGKMQRFVDLIFRHPALYPAAAFVYRNIFIPLFYKRLSRN